MPTLLKHALIVVSIGLLLLQCKSAKTPVTEAVNPDEPVVSYEKDLKPIMVRSCTPCHFPDKGRKEMLDTYAATKQHIKAIIARVELAPDDVKYMPFKSKREALTQEEIELFKTWLRQGMAE